MFNIFSKLTRFLLSFSTSTLSICFLWSVLPAFSQQSCILTDSGKLVCGKSQNNVNSSNSVKQQEIYDYIFKINGCTRRTPSLVKCEYTITNRGKETLFKIVNNYFDANKNSRMIDSSGRIHPVSSIEFGGFKADNYVDVTMFNGINYKASLDFKDISDEISQIPFLRLVVQDTRNNEFFVDFRDINISSTSSQESCVLTDSGKLVCGKSQNSGNPSNSVKQQEI